MIGVDALALDVVERVARDVVRGRALDRRSASRRPGRASRAAAADPAADAIPAAPAGAAAQTRVGSWTWRSIALVRAGFELGVLHIEPLREDQARRGCRSFRTEPTALDGHDDHDRLAAVLDEARVPGLIGVRRALDGAGLAVDLVLRRPALEDVRGRTAAPRWRRGAGRRARPRGPRGSILILRLGLFGSSWIVTPLPSSIAWPRCGLTIVPLLASAE